MITKKPTEEELTNGIYDDTLNNDTDLITAIFNGKEIPLWFSDDGRTSEVTGGYPFVIEQAEYNEEVGDILVASTRGSWNSNGPIATPESPDYDYYAIHRYSTETGNKTSMWNFSTRSWSSPTAGSTIMFPRNGQWELLPASAGSIFETQWEDAVKDFPKLFDDKKGLKAKISLENPSESTVSNSTDKQTDLIEAPSKFNKKSADKITNFNPSTDTLEIDIDSFGINSSATFAAGKNKKVVKKKLAKRDVDFLYDEKKGGLYFNENGADKGFGDGGIIAILKGAPELTSDNLEFI